MLKLNLTSQFKRDLKLCKKRNYDINLLNTIIDTLRIPAALPPKNKDHVLRGNYVGRRECHISPDWLLIYRIDKDEIYLDRTGTHADLFDM
ncbi:MAG: type II toxin-antitoxin system YafQ family toxin [Lachnospiraceae bacterium]|jgi:mRNA interferase YafQ|uniref:type II toxin-antitoxin system YafQ family toxin n=1 Tax=Parablautia intestinalis TaxID=2320100 RepID=UPI00256F1399|nr:type II toxin-antitoxin system YafQ family toxin [Parablautia intestinalis]MCI8614038.1 type II toxin-antitoxin system YafQ family toxin [Lachnospiraceae bacterium]